MGENHTSHALPRYPTLIVWFAALCNLAAGATIAGVLVLIPTSLDPSEMISAGFAPWLEAAYAAMAFVALLVLTAAALRLWHSSRFHVLGAGLTALLAVGVIWACITVYAEYF